MKTAFIYKLMKHFEHAGFSFQLFEQILQVKERIQQ